MDKIIKGLLDAYNDRLSETIQHLIDNKTISFEDKGMFLMGSSSELFKLGYAFKYTINPDDVSDHSLALIPSKHSEKVTALLADLQKISLSERMDKAETEDEKKTIMEACNDARAKSGVISM
jgi:hypothetical protein